MLLFFVTLLTSFHPFNKYIIFSFSIACWVLIPTKGFWDNVVKTFFLFSAIYVISEVLNNYNIGGAEILSHLIAPTAFYRYGRWVMHRYKEENKRLSFLVISIILYLLPLFILNIIDISLVGIVNPTRSMLSEVNDSDTLSATLYGLSASVGIGCVSGFFVKGISKRLRIVLIAISILSVLVIVHLVNRTGLVILAMCVIASIILTSRKKSIWSLLFVASLVLVIAFLILKNINNDIIEAYAYRERDASFDVSEIGGRTVLWSDAIGKIFTHPFGWEIECYAHNLWLDIARVGGILPFIMSIIITVMVFKKVRIVLKRDNTAFSIIALSVFFAMILNSFVEPVIDASILFFSLLFFMIGIINSILVNLNNSIFFECNNHKL